MTNLVDAEGFAINPDGSYIYDDYQSPDEAIHAEIKRRQDNVLAQGDRLARVNDIRRGDAVWNEQFQTFVEPQYHRMLMSEARNSVSFPGIGYELDPSMHDARYVLGFEKNLLTPEQRLAMDEATERNRRNIRRRY